METAFPICLSTRSNTHIVLANAFVLANGNGVWGDHEDVNRIESNVITITEK